MCTYVRVCLRGCAVDVMAIRVTRDAATDPRTPRRECVLDIFEPHNDSIFANISDISLS